MEECKNSKTLNSSRNIVFGFTLKIYQLLMPFIVRTIIIYVLGIQYAGLNSLFSSILSVLNIAELGVGTIMVFYMYKPIEKNDTKKICALMRLYKIYYRIIGMVVLILGLLLSPFLTYLVKGEIPSELNLYILYFLNLVATVLSYWLFAYKNSLFQAHQRNDIVSKVTLITDTIKYALQITFLCMFRNYYYYVIILVFVQILNNVLIAIKAEKTYPMYKAEGCIPLAERKKINSSIKDVFYGQMGMVITLSVDSIVISAFLGLVLLAQYQNYYYIVNAVIAFFTIFYQSIRASIGTNIIVKNQDANFADFKFITFLVMAALTFCSSCLLNLLQPFIELWVGKDNLLDIRCVMLLVVYFVVYELAIMIGCYKDISGKWHTDRFRPLITAIANLTINIVLVQFIGLYGILLSTIISFSIINIPWLYKRVFVDVFNNKQGKKYFWYLFKKICILVFSNLIIYYFCNLVYVSSPLYKLIVDLIIIIFGSTVLIYIFNRKDSEWLRMWNLVKIMLGR